MKTKIILLSVVSSFVAVSAFGQTLESDDMYFNAKDRAKIKAQKPVEEAYIPYSKKSDLNQNDEPVYASNTTYSLRDVNPEFTARSNAQAAQTDNEDYFVANYQFNNAPANNLNQFNNDLSNWYGTPMYTSAYMGSAFNSWNSPYYGMHGMYNNPWYDPYYASNGFSSSISFGYYFGNPYSYGGNYNYGYQPYCGGSSWGYGGGYGYNNYGYAGYGYPSNVIIVNNNGEAGGRGVTHGKRPTSGAVVSGQTNNARTRGNTGSAATNNGNGRTYNGGRTSSSASTQQSAYYNRSWKNDQQTQMNSGGTNSSNRNWNTNNQQNSSSDFNRSNNSSNNNRSSSFDNGGGNSGASRSNSSSSSSGSSGSNGRSRGRD